MLKRLFSLLALSVIATAGYAQTPYDCTGSSGSVLPVYPNSCSNGYYISEVTTTGGTLNISNPTACANTTTNYTYYTGTGKILQANAGATVNFIIKYAVPPSSNGLQRTAFWIDFNQDGVFDNSTYNAITNPAGEQINQSIQPSGSIAPSTTGFAFVIPPLAKNGTTRMRVRSFAQSGSLNPPNSAVPHPCQTNTPTNSGETEDYDVFINNPCVKVDGILFKNVTSKGADVQWKPRGNERQFEYIVNKDPSDPGTGNRYVGGATNSMHIPDTFMRYVECETKYYFHIRAICDTDSHNPISYYYGPWTLDSFTTPPCCDNPKVDVVNITSYTALATWQPVKSVQAYEYAIRVDTILPTKGMVLPNTSVFLPGLQCSKEYYFFIRALCSPTPTSDWVVDSFLTQPCLSIDNTPNLPPFRLNAYPNPVRDVVTLSVMHGMKLTNADIIVTDLTGKVIMSKVMTDDTIELDLRSVPSGMYLVKYADGDRTQVVKIHKE